MNMKMASELTKDQLEALVHRVQSTLWFDVRDGWNADWNPDKEWSGETIEIIAEACADYGLKPSATPDADAVPHPEAYEPLDEGGAVMQTHPREVLGAVADMAAAQAEDALAQFGIKLDSEELGRISGAIYLLLLGYPVSGRSMALMRRRLFEGDEA